MTTGTVFDKHKLPLAKLVRAMMFYEQTGGKGKTADLARLLFVTWKTAYVLEMKLFEAYAAPGGPLSEKALIARGYWQGYNLWLLRDRRLVRRNKHGHEKSASPPPPEVSNDPS